jgi:hypothetical protein
MSEEHQHQHHLEFGGSAVKADFDGTISYQLINRVPVITASYTFSPLTARQFRYLLLGTFERESPFYQRHKDCILDARAVTGWKDGAEQFLLTARDTFRGLGGDLYVVTYEPASLPAGLQTFETIEDAMAAAKAKK